MTCPTCKLLNPSTAQRCDCGYDFVNNQQPPLRLDTRGHQLMTREVKIPSVIFVVIGAVSTLYSLADLLTVKATLFRDVL